MQKRTRPESAIQKRLSREEFDASFTRKSRRRCVNVLGDGAIHARSMIMMTTAMMTKETEREREDDDNADNALWVCDYERSDGGFGA